MGFELKTKVKLDGSLTVGPIACHCGNFKELSSVELEDGTKNEFHVCMACLHSNCSECYSNSASVA